MSATQFVLLAVSKIEMLPQWKKILKILRRGVATQNPIVTRQKADKWHPNPITRVTAQPNFKSYSSLTRVCQVLYQKHTSESGSKHETSYFFCFPFMTDSVKLNEQQTQITFNYQHLQILVNEK